MCKTQGSKGPLCKPRTNARKNRTNQMTTRVFESSFGRGIQDGSSPVKKNRRIGLVFDQFKFVHLGDSEPEAF